CILLRRNAGPARHRPHSVINQEEVMRSDHAILTFCHLRWDFVYQRPQHLLSRLASTHRVLFIEEPVEGALGWEFIQTPDNVLVCRPHTPSATRGFHPDQMPYLQPLVRELVEREAL